MLSNVGLMMAKKCCYLFARFTKWLAQMIVYDSQFFHSDRLKGLLGYHHDYPLFLILKLLITCWKHLSIKDKQSYLLHIFHYQKTVNKVHLLLSYIQFQLNCKKHVSSYNLFKICFHYALEVENIFYCINSV